MATFDDLRRHALALPQVRELPHRGAPSFRVNGKTFALWWPEGARTILKLTRDHQELLFEVRPDTFAPCKVGTVNWSCVELAHLDQQELRALIDEAWATVAPKSVQQARRAV
jgi:hypothetical protein